MHGYSGSGILDLKIYYLRDYLKYIRGIDTIGSKLEIEYREYNKSMVIYIYGMTKSDEVEITYDEYIEWDKLMIRKEKLNKLLKIDNYGIRIS